LKGGEKKMKKGLVLVLAVAVVAIGGYMLMGEINHGFVMGLIPKPGT
jgi:hypothetical protein